MRKTCYFCTLSRPPPFFISLTSTSLQWRRSGDGLKRGSMRESSGPGWSLKDNEINKSTLGRDDGGKKQKKTPLVWQYNHCSTALLQSLGHIHTKMDKKLANPNKCHSVYHLVITAGFISSSQNHRGERETNTYNERISQNRFSISQLDWKAPTEHNDVIAVCESVARTLWLTRNPSSSVCHYKAWKRTLWNKMSGQSGGWEQTTACVKCGGGKRCGEERAGRTERLRKADTKGITRNEQTKQQWSMYQSLTKSDNSDM